MTQQGAPVTHASQQHDAPRSGRPQRGPTHDLSGANTCVACGLCLPACPTYALARTEGASPRGRLALMRGLGDGAIAPSPRVAQLLDLCLECRACETACPSGVRFGHTMEEARALLHEQVPGPLWVRLIERLVLESCFARPRLLRGLAGALDLLHSLGLIRLATRLGRLGVLPGRLATMASMLPRPDGPAALGLGPVVEPRTSLRGTVALLTGCVADIYLAAVNRATIDVLTATGFRVLIPQDQACCGALHLHRGMRDAARALARANVRAFGALTVDAILTNSAGCGSTLVDYGALAGDGEVSQEGVPAHHAAPVDLGAPPKLAGPGPQGDAKDGAGGGGTAFAAKVRDVTEFLAERGIGSLRPLAGRVTFDDPCHLIHARRIREAPRVLLRQIPGIELVETPFADRCCGSAGLYSVTHADTSLDLLSHKLDDVLSVSPDIVTTANPGCLLHLRYGLGLRRSHVKALHIMELLARALPPA